MNRRHASAMCVVLSLAGCGRVAEQPAETPGPVTALEARFAVLNDVIEVPGVTRPQSDAAPLMTATRDRPGAAVYELAGGPFPRGTVVTEEWQHGLSFALTEFSHLYWIDDHPRTRFVHPCRLAVVSAQTGLVTIYELQSYVWINGSRFFGRDGDESAQLVFENASWEDYAASTKPWRPPDVATKPVHPATGIVPANFGGLVAIGERAGTRPQPDAGRYQELFELMSGGSQSAPVIGLEDGITLAELGASLRQQSLGLGKGDKFFLAVISHGTPEGIEFKGKFETWEDFCATVKNNVTAEHTNICLSTCHSGTAVPIIAHRWGWEGSVQVLASVNRVSSEAVSAAEGGTGTRCLYRHLKAELEAASADGTVTVNEVEAAFRSMKITDEEFFDKMCEEYYEGQGGNDKSEFIYQWFLSGGAIDGGTPVGGGNSPTGGPAVALEVLLPPGAGTTNDGFGSFDLASQTLFLTGNPPVAHYRGDMILVGNTNPPGDFAVSGPLVANPGPGLMTFAVAGEMMVFPGAQLETLTGTLTVELVSPTLVVQLDATHTEGQQASLGTTKPLPPTLPEGKGDFDDDGDVDLEDWYRFTDNLLSDVEGDLFPIPEELERADLNGDGRLTYADYRAFFDLVTGSKAP